MSMVKRVRGFVQRLARRAKSSDETVRLTQSLVIGISQSKSVLLSEIGRAIAPHSDLRDTTRDMSEALIETSELDALPDAWLRFVAPVADRMPFIAVDGTDLSKPYGKEYEYLDHVRDSSAIGKPTRPGYWAINIEATDGHHTHLPLHLSVFSTKDPDFEGWTETFKNCCRARQSAEI